MENKQELTTEQMIVNHLKENGQKLKWLSGKIGVTTGHLFSVLKGDEKTKRSLTENNKIKINEALKTNF